MRKWPLVLISEFCTTGTGGTPSRDRLDRYFKGGTIPWVKSGELRENTIYVTEEHVTDLALQESNVRMVPAGALLLAMYGATVGRLGILGVAATTNQAICHIIPDPQRAATRYLFYAIRSQVETLAARGVGGAQPNISQGIVKTLRIPLPSLPEQRRIAAILDKADELRAKRRAALAKLDALTQSIFLDMFGDPATNPKGWPRVAFSQLLDGIESGWSPICLDRPATDEEWGVLKLGAVTWCEYDQAENKALPPTVEPKPELEVRPGDLLFSRKNTYELVAACALVQRTRPRLLLPDLVFRFRILPDAPVVKDFLHQLLIYPTKRREVQKLAGGSAGSMPNISKGRLESLPIELPSVHEQQAFAKRLSAISRSKTSQSVSLRKLNGLFASLQHRAFRGEL